jgi:hypothetical protein
MIPTRYRSEYLGEFVVSSTDWRRGNKVQDREWIPNPIENQHISGVAAVIGTSVDRELFDYAILESHKGGLQGRRRLQTYGTGEVWKHLRLNFYVTTDQRQLNSIHNKEYGSVDSVVYTTARHCLRYPGDFYLVPHIPAIKDPALAMYLAAFDGHQEIYLIGLNADSAPLGSELENDVDRIIKSYPTHQFVLVGVESNMPDKWRYNNNVSCLTYRRFISHCDVG